MKKIINTHLLLQLTNINNRINTYVLIYNLKCLEENFIDLDLEFLHPHVWNSHSKLSSLNRWEIYADSRLKYRMIRLRGLSENFRKARWKWLFVTHPRIDTLLIPTDSFTDPQPPPFITPLGLFLMGLCSRCKTPLGKTRIPWLTWNPSKFPRGYVFAQVLQRTVGTLPKGTRFTLRDIYPLCDSFFHSQFLCARVLYIFWDRGCLGFFVIWTVVTFLVWKSRYCGLNWLGRWFWSLFSFLTISNIIIILKKWNFPSIRIYKINNIVLQWSITIINYNYFFVINILVSLK